MQRTPLTISKKALAHLKKIATADKPNILIGVEGGGCNGMKYFGEPVDKPMKMDVAFSVDGAEIIVCGRSLLYLIGTHVTWKTDIMGSRIEFENPNAQSKCGCGETFNVKTSAR